MRPRDLYENIKALRAVSLLLLCAGSDESLQLQHEELTGISYLVDDIIDNIVADIEESGAPGFGAPGDDQ